MMVMNTIDQSPQEKIIAALKRAVDLAGSQTALAILICASQPNISRMLRCGRVTPAMALKIAEATKNKVKAHELNPRFAPAVEQGGKGR